MSTYIIEDNINFYDELFKSLDDSDTEDDTQLCQITGLPLIDKSVILECNHHFNYDALYKEICRQKYDFKTYSVNSLNKIESSKVMKSNLDYFIKCPYCRNIQFTILPYYEELGFEKKYGINSLEKPLDKPLNNNFKTKINKVDQTFKYGVCNHLVDFFNINTNESSQKNCHNKYVATIPETNLSYCFEHYNYALKQHKFNIKKAASDAKQQKIEEIKKHREEIKKQKEEEIKEKLLLFEKKNAERELLGLPPLKRLPSIKKKTENIVKEPQIISEYVPDDNEEVISLCKAIIKSGSNKGKECGCKTDYNSTFCKRHQKKNLEATKLETIEIVETIDK